MKNQSGIAESAMRSSGFLPRLVAGVLLINLCVAALAWWGIRQNFNAHHEQAKLVTQNLARALESDISGSIGADEMVLLSVLDEYRRQGERGKISATGLNAYIEQVRMRRPDIDAIRITDAQGVLRFGTGVKPEEFISLADRPHFIRLRDDPAAGLVFSPPQISRVNGKWVIVLAHRLTRPDGSFDGMVFAAIQLTRLSKTFATLDIGKNGMVALRDMNLGLIVRYPKLPELGVGSNVPSIELPDLVAAGKTSGTYTSVSSVDRVERTISFRKLADYPFYVQVGLAREDYLAASRDEAADVALLVALFALLTLAASWLIYVSWQWQRQINRALAESETRLNELFENMSSGVAVYRVSEDGQHFVFSGFNRAAEHIEHKSRSEVIGRDVVEAFPGIIEQGLLEVFRRVWQTGRAERFPVSVYGDGHIVSWRDNFVYKLPSGEVVAIYDDITERKQAEFVLRQSEEGLKEAQRLAHLGSWHMDLATNQVFWSEELYKMYGFDPALPPPLYSESMKLFTPESWERLSTAIAHVVESGIPYELELETVPKGGGQGWMLARGELVRDANGVPVRVRGVVMDITARKLAEQSVRLSMERLNEAQRIAQVGNWELDLIGGYLYWSDEIFDLFEIDRAKFGASYEAFLNAIHPDDREMVNQAYTRSLETREPYEVMHRLLMKDGRIKWVNERCETLYDEQGKAIRSAGTVQDITQRKSVEDALRQSEAYNKLLFADSRVPMVVIDAATGRYIDCNQAAVEIYDMPNREVVLGLTPLDVSDSQQYDGEDSASAIRSKIEHALQHGSVMFEWRHRRQSGEIWDARVHLMRLQQGDKTYLLFTLEDITETKQIGERLRLKSEALQRSNADLERFAYSVSHDMRQPLRAVSGHLQLLQRSMKNKLDDDERENMNFALEGAKRMDSMIVSLLEYSRVGRKTEEKSWLPAHTALDDAMSFLEPMIHDSSAIVNVAGEWPQVFASRDELTRLFQNLVGNGIKFCEQGKVPHVEIESAVDGGIWRVRVRDQGIGIDPQQIDRLFHFFSRLQARTRFDGTGMGLALCRRIVEHHGGKIWAESEGEGKGSTISFELPLDGTVEKEGGENA